MDYLTSEIEAMLYFLEKKEKLYSAVLSGSPEGTLHCKRWPNGRYSYMHCIRKDLETGQHHSAAEDPPMKRYRYQRRGITKDPELLRALADKEYARCMLKLIQHNTSILIKAKASLKAMNPSDVYASMKTVYRTLPEDWFSEIKRLDFALSAHTAWAEEPYEMSTYKPEERKFETSRGAFVRTRSELHIIEKLYGYQLVPRYEQVLRIGRYELAPDFTFKGRDGREFYWEYCGMMDDVSYVDRFFWRRKLYEQAGIFEWNDMICTFGTKNHFNIKEVIHVIEDRILPRI